jgi:Raf kinase inhibitor-like YbhB/YbcL family protein
MTKYLLLLAIIISTITLEGIMKLSSPAFDHNGPIPAQYTCDGTNISPALQWTDAPATTKSFALVVDDPDAPAKVWVHWILFNIPADINNLTEKVQSGEFTHGATDFNGKQQYGGLCPPSGTHHYHFTLYALDTMLNVPAGTSKNDLLNAMNGHILEQTTLIGTYQAKK